MEQTTERKENWQEQYPYPFEWNWDQLMAMELEVQRLKEQIKQRADQVERLRKE